MVYEERRVVLFSSSLRSKESVCRRLERYKAVGEVCLCGVCRWRWGESDSCDRRVSVIGDLANDAPRLVFHNYIFESQRVFLLISALHQKENGLVASE